MLRQEFLPSASKASERGGVLDMAKYLLLRAMRLGAVIAVAVLMVAPFARAADPPSHWEMFCLKAARLQLNVQHKPVKVTQALASFAGPIVKTFKCPSGCPVDEVTVTVTTKVVPWDPKRAKAGSSGTYTWNAKSTIAGKKKTITCDNELMLDPSVTAGDESGGDVGQLVDEGLLYHELLHCQLLLNAMDTAAWQLKACKCEFDMSPSDPNHTQVPGLVNEYMDSRAPIYDIKVVEPPAQRSNSDGDFDIDLGPTDKTDFQFTVIEPDGGSNVDLSSIEVTKDENGRLHLKGRLINKSKPGKLFVRIDPQAEWIICGIENGLFVIPPEGCLTLTYDRAIPNHFWYPNPDPYNEMLSLLVEAGLAEDVTWETIILQSYGTGYDQLASAEVWLDNGNGVVGLGDTRIGSGTYQYDDGWALIPLALPGGGPVVIPAGQSVRVLVSYAFGSTTALPLGQSYAFLVSGVGASGTTTITIDIPVRLDSATKVIGVPPISISQAKLPHTDPVLVEGKLVTSGSTDYPAQMGLIYIAEPNASRGIGVLTATGIVPQVARGDRLSVLGWTRLIPGPPPQGAPETELVIEPQNVTVAPGQAVQPMGMGCKSTGGGSFGLQPGVLDDAYSSPAEAAIGLNTVGALVRICGAVTGEGQVEIGGSFFDVFWMDDGSVLRDGFMPAGWPFYSGVAVALQPGLSPVPFTFGAVTGIIRAIPNPTGAPVRLIVPRDVGDITAY